MMVEVEIHGVKLMLPEHRKREVDWETWERERLLAMKEDVKEGDVIFDIGAEQGDITAFLGKLAGPTGNVCPFEPSPHVWPNIRAIFMENDLPTPLTHWAGFISDDNDYTPRHKNVKNEDVGGWPGCAYGNISDQHGFRHVCWESDASPSKKLDTIMHEGVVPDLITMDIEGAELKALQGASQLLRTHSPIVYVSVHPPFLDEMYGQSKEELLEYMSEMDYTGTLLAIDHEEHWKFVK